MKRIALLGLSLLAGCSEDFGTGPPGFEAGAPCPAGQLNLPTGCAEPPGEARPAVCPFVASHLPECVDADGDCFVAAGCAFPPALAPYADGLTDCDDARPTVRPDAVEACNGLDDDCDGLTDEDFLDIGRACDACGAPGKLECAVGGVADDGEVRLACSTAPGQSSPAEFPAEICDGADTDCDGQVDEGCALPAPPGAITGLAGCGGDAVLATTAEGVFWLDAGEGGWTATPLRPEGDRAAHHPACLGEHAAWLEGGECAEPADGPARCVGASVVRLTPDGPVDLTGGTAAGGLRLDPEGGLWWHVVIEGQPQLVRHAAGEVGLSRPEDGLYLSDPVPVPDGVVVRQWVNSVPEVAWLADGSDPQLRDQPGRPEPPAATARWLAWPYDGGAGLWVIDMSDPSPFGFQPTTGAGPHRGVHVASDTLLWHDAGRGEIRALSLRTGVAQALVEGLPEDAPWAIGPQAVVWLDGEGALRRQPLP